MWTPHYLYWCLWCITGELNPVFNHFVWEQLLFHWQEQGGRVPPLCRSQAGFSTLAHGTRAASRDTGICQASVLSISTFNWTSQREVVDHGQVDSGQNGVKLEVSTVEKIVRVPQSGGHLSELAIVGFTNLKLKYFCKLWQAEELAALNCNYISIKSC